MDWSTCLLRKTLMNSGINILDIHPRMLFDKLLLTSLVYPLSFYQKHPLPAKAAPEGRYMIIPIHHQENKLSAHSTWYMLTSLVLCPLNHDLGLVMSSLSSMTYWVIHLLHFCAAKMPLHSIFRLWLPGLKHLLVTHSPLCIQTKGRNSWLENYNCSSRPEG
jgi:hypothetical protein